MNISLKEMLAVVAFLTLALWFALHVRSTERRLASFELNSRHVNAGRDFESRMLLVEENFHRAGFTLLGDLPGDRIGVNGGTFERTYTWGTDGKPAVRGIDLCELFRPLTAGFTNTQYIYWDVASEPTFQQIQSSTPQTSGTMIFRITYRLH